MNNESYIVNKRMKAVVSGFVAAAAPARRPIILGESFQVFADPWPFQTAEQLVSEMADE